MNNQRRKAIRDIQDRVQSLFDSLDAIKGEIEQIRDDEQEYLDNMPENMQSGERGETANAAIDELEGAISEIEELTADEITAHLDAACEG